VHSFPGKVSSIRGKRGRKNPKPKLGVMEYICYPSTQKAEAGRSRVRGQPDLHIRRPCLKRERKEKKEIRKKRERETANNQILIVSGKYHHFLGGEETQGLRLARQVFYHLCHSASPIFCVGLSNCLRTAVFLIYVPE
jgi:hypothetical protein